MNPRSHLILPMCRRLLLALGLAVSGLPSPAKDYAPTRESLSEHAVPDWYRDAKIGFFYHWGPSSILGDRFNQDTLAFCRAQGKYAGQHLKDPPGQWGSTMYPRPGKPDSQQGGSYLLQRRWYGDPKEFGYKDLIPFMTGEKFDPDHLVHLLKNAGARYIVPMAIHHDGFAMWDSQVIDQYNAVRMGPKKDTTKLVVDAGRRLGLKVGVSTHAMRHSWYFPKLEGYDTNDPRYIQLYGEGLDSNRLPFPSAIRKWEDTMKELIDTFHPDYIFKDGGTADVFCDTGSYVCIDALRRVVAYYYNAAAKGGWEPVITFKRESLYKEEAVPDYEGGLLANIAPYVWQTHSPITGWFYRNERPQRSEALFRRILDVVSKNGNLLLNVGLKADGSIPDTELAYLADMTKWTGVVGEAIYATRPWLVSGELEPGAANTFVENTNAFRGIVYRDPERVKMGSMRFNPGDIRFTRSKDGRTVYAARFSWGDEPFTLRSFAADGIGREVKVAGVSLLGSAGQCEWRRTAEGLTIVPPSAPVFPDRNWPVVYKIEIQ